MTHSRLAELALETGLADQAELDRIVAAWREWGEDESGWFTVVHGEVLRETDGRTRPALRPLRR